MRIYNLLATEHALSNIALRRMRTSRFTDVNDPFELLAVNVGGRKDFRKALKEWKTSLNDEKGLLCFSKDWKNPVIWSHYATKHRGICLGFDLKDELANPVEYTPQRILAELDGPVSEFTLNEELVNSLLCTKYEHWAYEREVRVFVDLKTRTPEAGSYFYPFSDSLALREVILGPLCELPLESVKSFVNAMYSDVAVSKARLAFKWFQVVPYDS